MRTPFAQSLPHWFFVACSIINPRHATFMSANVVQDRFDYMRQHTKVSHPGCRSAPKIVDDPMRHRFGFGLYLPPIPQERSCYLYLSTPPANRLKHTTIIGPNTPA